MAIIIGLMEPQPEKTIRLDTALGNAIDNCQISEISQFESNQFRFYEKWKRTTELRNHPTPRYNCHGMTFASRRTGITEISAVLKILKEDGYREVIVDEVLPGDIIIYYGEEGDLEHSGVVISNPEAIAPASYKIPKVISKWGKYSELIHWANDCPYTFKNARYFRVMANNDQQYGS